MWNPFRTLVQSDGMRLRRLERTVESLADDVEKVLRLAGKVNDRLRMRARREADLIEEEPSSAMRSTEEEASGNPPPFLLPSSVPSSFTPPSSNGAPLYSKDQMREFARQRGLSREIRR